MANNCDNCRHEDLSERQSPCSTCYGYPDWVNWQPKQKEDKPMPNKTTLNDFLKFNGDRLLDPEKLKVLEGCFKLEPASRVWKPKDGEKVYCIGNGCSVGWIVYNSCNKNHVAAYLLNSLAPTEKEMEFIIQKEIVTTELQRFADEHNDAVIDWADECQAKYHMWYDYRDECIFVEATVFRNDALTAFASEQTALAAIATIGEARIKKYYLGGGVDA